MSTDRTQIAPLPSEAFDEVRRDALANGKQIEPTEEEARNGWTARTLTAYLAGRAESQLSMADVLSRPQKRPSEANHHYRPHRWRG